MSILNRLVGLSRSERVVTGRSLLHRDASSKQRQAWIGNLATELFDYVRCAILGRNHNDPNPLARRMAALGIDACEARIIDPMLAYDMERLCWRCDNREYCVQALNIGCTGVESLDCEDWRDYCPNSLALEMLSALQSRSR